MQFGAQAVEPFYFRCAQRHDRLRCQRPQPRQRLSRMIAERVRHVLGEADHPALGGARLKPIAMCDGCVSNAHGASNGKVAAS